MNNSVEGIKGIGGIMSEVTLYNGTKIPMVGYGSFLSTEKEGKQDGPENIRIYLRINVFLRIRICSGRG